MTYLVSILIVRLAKNHGVSKLMDFRTVNWVLMGVMVFKYGHYFEVMSKHHDATPYLILCGGSIIRYNIII